MRKIGSKKRFALVASTTAAVLIGSGIAVAFWTTSGSGNGSAATGTTATLAVTQTNTVANLYPGGPAIPLDISVNNTVANPQTIATITVTRASVTGGGPLCTIADYAVTSGTATGANNVAASGATAFPGLTSGASVHMVESGFNQNDCKGATINLTYAVS